MYRLHLVLVGLAAWTLLEYLVHRFVFHLYSVGRRLHQLHHDHPNDPDSERSSLSTPLLALPIGCLLIGAAGVEDGSAIFAGLLSGYLVFIFVHYAVHRWPIEPNSWLYSAKLRHLTHHRLENCNYGVTTIFWDIVFRTVLTKCHRSAAQSERLKVLSVPQGGQNHRIAQTRTR